MNEIPGMFTPRGGFAQLLGDPLIRRGTCHRNVDDPARVQFDDNENVDGSEEQIVGRGEVTTPDLPGVVLQESGPGLTP